MKIAGFTIIRNAIKYDFPVIESIKSILPICDTFYVSIGNSEDSTQELIQSIQSQKIKISHSQWDDTLRKNGEVLAVETNKLIHIIPEDYDWLFYLQADEVIHEEDLSKIKMGMENNLDNKNIDGLLFNYIHFFGSYQFIGNSRKWYRNEIRVIRNNKNILSYKDAQGFRKKDGSKLAVKSTHAKVFHYGWVKHPKDMLNKIKNNQAFYTPKEKMGKTQIEMEKMFPNLEFDYNQFDVLKKFEGSHPKVMKQRIDKKNWNFQPDYSKIHFRKRRYYFLYLIEKYFGVRLFEYKNYILK